MTYCHNGRSKARPSPLCREGCFHTPKGSMTCVPIFAVGDCTNKGKALQIAVVTHRYEHNMQQLLDTTVGLKTIASIKKHRRFLGESAFPIGQQ